MYVLLANKPCFKHGKSSNFVFFPGRLYALQQGFILQEGKEDLDYLLDLVEWLGGKKEELKSLMVNLFLQFYVLGLKMCSFF